MTKLASNAIAANQRAITLLSKALSHTLADTHARKHSAVKSPFTHTPGHSRTHERTHAHARSRSSLPQSTTLKNPKTRNNGNSKGASALSSADCVTVEFPSTSACPKHPRYHTSCHHNIMIAIPMQSARSLPVSKISMVNMAIARPHTQIAC